MKFSPLLLLFASLSYGVQPSAVIDQGASVTLPSGGGVFLSAKKSTGEGPKLWHVGTIIGFLESDGFPLVGPRDGVYQVELVVLGMVDGKPAWSSAPCTVTVGGAPPGPNPPPVPPGPTPLPDGKYRLAQFTYDTVVQKVASVPRSRAAALAAAYDAAIAQGGTGSDTAVFLDLTRRNNQAALGSDLAAWEAARVAMMERVAALNLRTVADMCQAWSEISTGLKAVK